MSAAKPPFGACETWSWHGTERAKNEKQRINKGSVPISLPFCQYVYLSVCIGVCPCVCLVSLAWLCLPLLGSAWLCSALRACLAVLRSVWLCLAQKSYGSSWELMEAFFFEIKAWPVLEVQIEVWRQSFGIRWNTSFHRSGKPFSLKSRLSQFWSPNWGLETELWDKMKQLVS